VRNGHEIFSESGHRELLAELAVISLHKNGDGALRSWNTLGLGEITARLRD
jgi:hypothetical protein